MWRVCFFGSAVVVTADLRERMFDHSRQLSQQYYQVNKVGNLMSLYTNDLDTIQECFGDGILMFFDASVLGLLALFKMWRMDYKLTLLALIPRGHHVRHRHHHGHHHDQTVGGTPAGFFPTCLTSRRRISPASRSSRPSSKSTRN